MRAPGKLAEVAGQDAAIFDAGGICLRGTRADRFKGALYEIAHAAESLEASLPLFPSVGPNPGDIDAYYAVKSFAEYTARRLKLLMNAVINEDLLSDPLLSTGEGDTP